MTLIHTPRAILALGLLGLTACSGGGPSPPVAPSVTSTVGVKQLLFSWGSAPGTDLYRVKSNPDGVSGFTQTGADLPAAQTSFHLDVTVHRQNWQNARYLVEACNTLGCADSSEISFAGDANAAIGYFKPTNTGVGDHFGTAAAVSADGGTLAVGSPQEDSSATGINGDDSLKDAAAAGAVYVFTRDDTGAWRQQAYIKAANSGAGDLFGYAVAMSSDGNTLAVGAYQEDGPDSTINGANGSFNTAGGSGAVYIFTRDDAGNWTQQAYVKASNNTGRSSHFGYAVALSGNGDALAVGAPDEDGAATGIDGDQFDFTATNPGAVFVFTRDGGGSWHQQAYVKASNTAPNDNFGNAVALDDGGDTLAVGAYQEDSNATGIDGDQTNNLVNGAGAVYVFTRDNAGTWSQQAYVKASNTGAGDQFGYAVTLNGNGNTLAVGAPFEDTAAADAGAVYLFTRDGAGAWSQQSMLKADIGGAADYFGRALALDDNGDILVAGAPGEDSAAAGIGADPADNSADGAGAAYVFTQDASGTWRQSDYLKAPNPDANDHFGASVAVSSDGGTIAVGADLEDGGATGSDADETDNSASGAGSTYLY